MFTNSELIDLECAIYITIDRLEESVETAKSANGYQGLAERFLVPNERVCRLKELLQKLALMHTK
jgi:sporulation-control protein spo0M